MGGQGKMKSIEFTIGFFWTKFGTGGKRYKARWFQLGRRIYWYRFYQVG